MTRNTTRRVEVAVPILDTDVKNRLLDGFRTMLKDTCKLRIQLDDGSYVRVQGDGERFNSQEYFAEKSYRRAGEKLPEEANTVNDEASLTAPTKESEVTDVKNEQTDAAAEEVPQSENKSEMTAEVSKDIPCEEKKTERSFFEKIFGLKKLR